jgi:hypothetical protein
MRAVTVSLRCWYVQTFAVKLRLLRAKADFARLWARKTMSQWVRLVRVFQKFTVLTFTVQRIQKCENAYLHFVNRCMQLQAKTASLKISRVIGFWNRLMDLVARYVRHRAHVTRINVSLCYKDQVLMAMSLWKKFAPLNITRYLLNFKEERECSENRMAKQLMTMENVSGDMRCIASKWPKVWEDYRSRQQDYLPSGFKRFHLWSHVLHAEFVHSGKHLDHIKASSPGFVHALQNMIMDASNGIVVMIYQEERATDGILSKSVSLSLKVPLNDLTDWSEDDPKTRLIHLPMKKFSDVLTFFHCYIEDFMTLYDVLFPVWTSRMKAAASFSNDSVLIKANLISIDFSTLLTKNFGKRFGIYERVFSDDFHGFEIYCHVVNRITGKVMKFGSVIRLGVYEARVVVLDEHTFEGILSEALVFEKRLNIKHTYGKYLHHWGGKIVDGKIVE